MSSFGYGPQQPRTSGRRSQSWDSETLDSSLTLYRTRFTSDSYFSRAPHYILEDAGVRTVHTRSTEASPHGTVFIEEVSGIQKSDRVASALPGWILNQAPRIFVTILTAFGSYILNVENPLFFENVRVVDLFSMLVYSTLR